MNIRINKNAIAGAAIHAESFVMIPAPRHTDDFRISLILFDSYQLRAHSKAPISKAVDIASLLTLPLIIAIALHIETIVSATVNEYPLRLK